MALQYPLIEIAAVAPGTAGAASGWTEGEFRAVLDERHGASSTFYQAVLGPGEIRQRHVNESCDEMYYVMSGHGLAGADGECVELFAGHYHLIAKGVEHWLANAGRNDPLVVIGLYDRAPAPEAAGSRITGTVGEAQLTMPRTARPRHALVHDDAVPLVKVSREEGWTQDYFCEPLNRRNGAGTCWMYGYFGPGTIHNKHRHTRCEEICYALRGNGVAGVGDDRVDFRTGHVHYIPTGVEHWLANVSDSEVLIAPGFYIGVGGLDESGFEYIGPVMPDDLERRTPV